MSRAKARVTKQPRALRGDFRDQFNCGRGGGRDKPSRCGGRLRGRMCWTTRKTPRRARGCIVTRAFARVTGGASVARNHRLGIDRIHTVIGVLDPHQCDTARCLGGTGWPTVTVTVALTVPARLEAVRR